MSTTRAAGLCRPGDAAKIQLEYRGVGWTRRASGDVEQLIIGAAREVLAANGYAGAATMETVAGFAGRWSIGGEADGAAASLRAV
jgi:hypothetical protein